MCHYCIWRVFAIPAEVFSLALDRVIIPEQREYIQGYILGYSHLLRKCRIVFDLGYFLLQPVNVI